MGKLIKLAEIEATRGITRRQLYAMRAAGLVLHNIGSGGKRPTWAVDPAELERFMSRPLDTSPAVVAPRRRLHMTAPLNPLVRC